MWKCGWKIPMCNTTNTGSTIHHQGAVQAGFVCFSKRWPTMALPKLKQSIADIPDFDTSKYNLINCNGTIYCYVDKMPDEVKKVDGNPVSLY
jgi:hypothetical protein